MQPNYPYNYSNNYAPAAVPPMGANYMSANVSNFAGYGVQQGTGAMPYSNPCATTYQNMEFQSSEQLMATNFQAPSYQTPSYPNPAANYTNNPFCPQYQPQYQNTVPQYVPTPVAQPNYYPQHPQYPVPQYPVAYYTGIPTYLPSAPTETVTITETVEEPDQDLLGLQSENQELQIKLVGYRSEIHIINAKISSMEQTTSKLISKDSKSHKSKSDKSTAKEANQTDLAIQLSQLYTDLELAAEKFQECELLLKFNNLKLAEYSSSN